MFFIMATIIGLAASLITIKTLVGYNQLNIWVKLLVSAVVLFCWLGHSLLSYCRHHGILPLPYYTVFTYLTYFALAFGFILLVILLVRDTAWFATYGIAKIVKSGYAEKLDPFNVFYLGVSNVVSVVLALMLVVYGAYEALKFPDVKTVEIVDAKIKKPIKSTILVSKKF